MLELHVSTKREVRRSRCSTEELNTTGRRVEASEPIQVDAWIRHRVFHEDSPHVQGEAVAILGRSVAYDPQSDGNLLIFGSSGSGKTMLLWNMLDTLTPCGVPAADVVHIRSHSSGVIPLDPRKRTPGRSLP
ncbi:hypothetical protein [Agromyces subbeticus]|uniref:hypothetical protein n=1 Tax=Agromyces subbeticus TaxID=293890 RepID=UPI0003B682E0|nr:hypothetical protein [Agromyces subbeticus]